ncbi:MAG: TIGR03943 family protein [Chroococcidiopsidaceae cyanobacterium CP_BM_ER_R8_30]|nr:TIGR03943 family protein [Chroococcidiopsidaceae cyanobacterium CP_BM_ER_R8_30]
MNLRTQTFLLPWLDVLAIASWGILLLKYWLNGKLGLLIHPDYFWLVTLTALVMLTICGLQVRELRRRRSCASRVAHLTLFPPGLSSSILLLTALLGLVFTPHIFTSQIALQRGVTDTVAMTRAQPQAFRSSRPPEERTLVDWVRMLNVYPEPDEYTGQKVNVQGFVIHPPELPPNLLMLSRFVITCCAADAYPVGLPVKLDQTSKAYPSDSWLEVQGQMITENLAGKRQLTIQASSIRQITEPKNPYDY